MLIIRWVWHRGMVPHSGPHDGYKLTVLPRTELLEPVPAMVHGRLRQIIALGWGERGERTAVFAGGVSEPLAQCHIHRRHWVFRDETWKPASPEPGRVQ